MNIDQLLREIETWKAANDEYELAHLAWDECDTEPTWEARKSAITALYVAAAWFTDNPFTKKAKDHLRLFIVLTNEIERLQAIETRAVTINNALLTAIQSMMPFLTPAVQERMQQALQPVIDLMDQPSSADAAKGVDSE